MSESEQCLDCLICTPNCPETKILKNMLLKRLQKEINLHGRSAVLLENQEKQGFKQILRIVFGVDLNREGRQCQHLKFQKFLLKRLECQKEVLNYACERLAYSIAQKNYHLELVRQQIKHVAESISHCDLLFELGDQILSQSYKSQERIGERESGRRVTRTMKKTSLQNIKNQVISLSKIQQQPQIEPLPSLSSLSFIPLQTSQQNQQAPHNINLGYNYYFPTYPFFYCKRQ